MTDRLSQPPSVSSGGAGIPLRLAHPDNLLAANDDIKGAYCCGTINNFVLIGNYLEGSNFQRNFVRWCAIGDPTDWPTPETSDARAKQAGKEELSAEFGWVTGIAGNDFYGYVFQETGITKVTYVGGDIVFTFDVIEPYRGCIRTGRMAQIDENSVIFESEKGAHLLSNDVVTDIGFGSVDDTYF